MMKLRWPLMFLLACAGATVALAAGEAAFDPETMLDPSQVQRGDEAVAKTVFSGVQITEFRLQIIDVLKQANMGQDMILARLLDGPVVERQCGIVGGMSGSPVYVRGKLIGAIAWGWPFQKEPIAGITPIRAMLEALDTPAAGQAQAPASRPSWTASRPFTLAGRRYHGAAALAPGQAPTPGMLPLRPVMTPLQCSGFGPQTLKLAAEKFGPYAVEPMAGGGTKADIVPVELEAGAAVGVRFMEGDFDMTGIGTVTWRKGDRLLAFGHPLMQLGRVNMPLTTAWINDFIPSYMRTDKMGSGMANVGALQSDAAWAIAGQVGPAAPLIPARIEVVDRSRNVTRVYNIKVFDQPSLTPVVLGLGISQALEAAYNPGKECTLRTHYEIRGRRGARLARDDQYYLQGSPAQAGAEEAAGMMMLLEDNRWEPQGIAEMTYRAEITARDETATIEKAYSEENVAKAGKPLRIHALIRPVGGPLQDHVFTLHMPLDLPKGTLRLGIGSGNDALYFRSRFGIMLPNFESLPEVVAFVDKMEQNKQLCVVAALPDEGTIIGSTRLMRLPPSIGSVFEKSTRTDVDTGRSELFASLEPGFVIQGREAISLATEDRTGDRGKVTSETKKSGTSSSKSGSSSSSSKEGEEATGLDQAAPRGLWWAEQALKPLTARRLRAEAAAAGAPWPAADEPPKKKEPTPAKDDAAKKDETKKDAEPDTDADTDADADADADADDPDEDDKDALIRQPTVWLEQTAEEFAKGQAKGLALCSEGGLRLGPAATDLGRWKEGYVWNTLSQGDTTFLATGTPGRIYRLKGNGPAELLCDLGVFAVRGLAADATGNLYAGTWPGGQIFRLGADGKPALFCQLPCDYVWALAFDKAGRLLAGTGPEGKLFAVDTAGKAQQLTQLPQGHILSLAVQGDSVLLGSGSKGIIYEWTPDKPLRALASMADEEDVTSLVSASPGLAYAASAGDDGAVYRLQPAGTPAAWQAERLAELKDLPVYGLAVGDGLLYAATGEEGKLLAITARDRYETLADTDETHLLCVAPCPEGFVVGSGNAAAVTRLRPAAPAEGEFTSSVLDAARTARWGAIDWKAAVPAGTAVVIQTRSGDSPDPEDGSWSVWSVPYTRPGQESISSPAARYLQYRVQMKREAAGTAAPRLRWLSLGYLPANQAPTVEFDDELTIEKPWKGEVEFSWTGTDADKDELSATLEYRAADAEAWQTIKRITGDDETYTWKTKDLKDGRYDVRVVVSDEAANPGAALTGEAVFYSVVIDNTAPDHLVQKTEAKDGLLTVEGMASDETRVTEVAYQVEKEWRGALPVDGFFDGRFEQFRFRVALDKDGKAKISLRSRDAAGNLKTTELVWPLPAETPARDDKKEPKQTDQ